MICRHLSEIMGTEREVGGEHLGWTSRRLLLSADKMGFSLHDTLIFPNKPLHLQYLHHLEAVYCIEGRASVVDVESGTRHLLLPGSLYALDRYERHVLEAEVTSRFVCVFNPPVRGDEVHDERGAYSPLD